MTYQEILANARTCMGPYCKSCPICNGLACKNTVPGPGAKGHRHRLYPQLSEVAGAVRQHGHHLRERAGGHHFSFFGKKTVLPVFAAPVGAMQLHYGDKYDDLTYNDILVSACADGRYRRLYRRRHQPRRDGGGGRGAEEEPRLRRAHHQALEHRPGLARSWSW